jgi:DNA-binding response OmpR family regulator
MAANLLLLEDDLTIRELLETTLVDDGQDVTICDSPEHVAQCASKLPRSLAVVDFWGQSHQTLSDQERDEIVVLSDAVPTILVSARTWAVRYPADELGLLAIVPKPFDLEEVSSVIGEHVARLIEDSAEVTHYG